MRQAADHTQFKQMKSSFYKYYKGENVRYASWEMCIVTLQHNTLLHPQLIQIHCCVHQIHVMYWTWFDISSATNEPFDQ